MDLEHKGEKAAKAVRGGGEGVGARIPGALGGEARARSGPGEELWVGEKCGGFESQ
jgi:hypothetical protein